MEVQNREGSCKGNEGNAFLAEGSGGDYKPRFGSNHGIRKPEQSSRVSTQTGTRVNLYHSQSPRTAHMGRSASV